MGGTVVDPTWGSTVGKLELFSSNEATESIYAGHGSLNAAFEDTLEATHNGDTARLPITVGLPTESRSTARLGEHKWVFQGRTVYGTKYDVDFGVGDKYFGNHAWRENIKDEESHGWFWGPEPTSQSSSEWRDLDTRGRYPGVDNIAATAVVMRDIRDNLPPGMEVRRTSMQEMWLNTRGAITAGTKIEEHEMVMRFAWEMVLLEDALLEWGWHLGVTTVVDGSVGHAVFDPESL